MHYKEILDNPNYKKLASVEHDKIKPFIVAEIEQKPFWAIVANYYQLCGSLGLFIALFKVFFIFVSTKETASMFALIAGILFSCTILIVLHELIHALAYYIQGARKISFGAKFSKFLFYVQADEEVFNYKQFRFVALAPLVSIAILSALGMAITYKQPCFYFFLSVFCLHSFGCAGDLGLLCFFENRPQEELLTFDLKKEEKTYFYKKINKNEPSLSEEK